MAPKFRKIDVVQIPGSVEYQAAEFRVRAKSSTFTECGYVEITTLVAGDQWGTITVPADSAQELIDVLRRAVQKANEES